MKSPSHIRVAVRIIAVMLLLQVVPTAFSQDTQSYLLQTGTPTFTTSDSFPSGAVSISNGNLHLEIELGRYPQRGGKDYVVKLVYNSKIWYQFNSGSSKLWESQFNGFATAAGWSVSTSSMVAPAYASGNVTWAINSPTCSGGTKWDNVYGPFVWTSPDGTNHVFPITTKQNYQCGGPVNVGGDAYALDGTGYHMYVNTSTGVPTQGTISLYDKHGEFIDLTTYGTGRQVKDSNGNYLVQDKGAPNFSSNDTLGRKVFSSPSGTWWGSSSWLNGIQLSNSQNQMSSFVPVVTNGVYGTTAFGAPGVTEYANWQFFLLQQLQLPDGSSYKFVYDCDSGGGSVAACGSPSGRSGYSGQLIGITFPTGGSLSFAYSTFLDANGTPSSWVTSRKSGSNTWTYAPATGCGTGCQTVTVTQPSGDQEVYTFTLNLGNGAWATTVAYYNGAATSSPQTTIQNNYQSYATASALGNWAYTLPTNTTVTVATPVGNLVKQTTYTYDTTSYSYGGSAYTGSRGKLLTKSEYSFGLGSVGALYRKTVNTYLDDTNTSYRNKNLLDLITDIQVLDATGNKKAETKVSYDTTTLTSVTGVTNHDDTAFGTGNTIRGNPTVIQRWTGTSYLSTTTAYYDTTGQVTKVTDGANNSTTFSYTDAFFNDSSPASNPPASFTPTSRTNAYVSSATLPLIGAASLGYYYGTGKLAYARDHNGADSYIHYLDAVDHLTHSFGPMVSGNRRWSLNAYVSPTVTDTYATIGDTQPSTTCINCRHDESVTDGLGRVTTKLLLSDPDGMTHTDTTYDSNGRPLTVSKPYRSTGDPTYGVETSYYDGLDRNIKTVHSDGTFVQTFYGASVSSNGGLSTQQCAVSTCGYGVPTLTKDEFGNLQQTWRDAFGRTIEVDEPGGTPPSLSTPVTTTSLYDVLDNLVTVNQGSQARSYSYDALSRVTSEVMPETGSSASSSGTTTIYYTTSTGGVCAGNPSLPCRVLSPKGTTTTFAYDALSRPTSRTYSDTTHAVNYYYDQTTYNGLTIANGKGRQTGMSDASGSTAWSFDPIGNVLTEMRTIAGVSKTINYVYNLDGSLASVQYPSGRTITYSYNTAKRATSAKDLANSISYASNGIFGPTGLLASSIHGKVTGGFAGITESHSYNARLEPNSISASSTAGTALNLTYNFIHVSGNNGNAWGITNGIDNTRSQTFGYDALGQISTAQSQATSGSNCWGQSYSIDSRANLATETVTKCSSWALSLTLNQKNQITNTGFTYDLNGDLTADGSNAYTFDADGELTSAAGVSYIYDGQGFRVEKSNGTLYWRSFDGRVLAETDLTGNVVNEYIYYDGRIIARRNSAGNVFYYFADYSGSTRAATNSQGAVCFQSDYLPYGQEINITNSCPQNYRFLGYERDSETGLDYAITRLYSSQLGRFVTIDGLDGFPDKPRSWNPYAFVLNNPVNLTDPLGMDPDFEGILSYDSTSGLISGMTFPASGSFSFGGLTVDWTVNASGVPSYGGILTGSNCLLGCVSTSMLNQALVNQLNNLWIRTNTPIAGASFPVRDVGTPTNQAYVAPVTHVPEARPYIKWLYDWNDTCALYSCTGVIAAASNFSAGAGDALTGRMIPFVHGSLTEMLRGEKTDKVVDKNGGIYKIGDYTGGTIGYTILGAGFAKYINNNPILRIGPGWKSTPGGPRRIWRLASGGRWGKGGPKLPWHWHWP